MFTGLIEDIGTLASIERRGDSAVLRIETKIPAEELVLGESIAINGICLTVTTIQSRGFTVDASHETLAHSSLGSLRRGSKIHLERAMRADGRLGGHIVQGHVDGVGTIARIDALPHAWEIYLRLPSALSAELVPKGSITVDGVSLTVNELTRDGCRLTIIPHTAVETRLATLKTGDVVNIETDIIGKYVRRFMQQEHSGAAGGGVAAALARFGYTEGDND